MKRSGPPARRTPLARGGQLERHTRIRPVSEKRQRQLLPRSIVVTHVRARDKTCRGRELAPWVRCWHPEGELLDVHEIIPRSAWPDGFLEVTNCILICRGHHDWVGDYPEAAAAVGLHGYSWQRPDQQGDHR